MSDYRECRIIEVLLYCSIKSEIYITFTQPQANYKPPPHLEGASGLPISSVV